MDREAFAMVQSFRGKFVISGRKAPGQEKVPEPRKKKREKIPESSQ
jgi:hypothetical protein